MLFLVAAVAFSVAAGGWWMQRIVFTPDDTRDTAAAILSEPDIRQEINTVITGASAPVLGVNVPELSTFLEDTGAQHPGRGGGDGADHRRRPTTGSSATATTSRSWSPASR